MKKVLVLVLTLVTLIAVSIPIATPILACEPPPSLDESPGYWKNHPSDWPETAAPPNTLFNDVFQDGSYPSFPGMTLMDVLWQGGGHEKRDGRYLVADYLNHYGALPPY